MLFVLRWLACYFFRALVWLRYRVQTRGLEKLRSLKGPTLILPNHPALVDPLILMTRTWPYKQPRPMLFVGNFRGLVMGSLMKLLNSAEVPPLDQFDTAAKEKAAKAIQDVIDGLKRGENFVMWPSGRLERDGQEYLGSATALTEILKAVPELNIVVVRTRGLFGSRSSYAYRGRSPSMGQEMLPALGWLLASLLFFMPRRRVTQTYEVVDKSQLPALEVDKVNRWFEAWYNAEGKEPPTFVPYHAFLGARTHEYPPLAAVEKVDMKLIRPDLRAEANQVLQQKAEVLKGGGVDPASFTPETTLESLGFNSLARMDLQLAVERRFGFTADETPETVGQVYALAAGLSKKGPPKPAPPEWFATLNNVPAGIEGETIPAAFVERALRCRRDVIVADDLAGAVTYERLLVGVLTMAKRFAKLEGENVGLLLPASVGADIALLGLMMAGKVPVILNWTTGEANLAHAAKVMELKTVVTSKAFLNRTAVKVEGTENLFVEDLRQGMGKFELFRQLLGVRWFGGSIRARVPKIDPDKPAVVLFTSGSEKAPKAVPLTHRNLLTNIRMGLAGFKLQRSDSILGFLPAFHSFGLTVTGLMPLLSGIRVVRHPDPTDAGGLTRKITSYKPTILAGTPTFVSYILARSEPGDLDSLHLIVVGAEKCPPILFETVKERTKGALLLEGYGITECSPVVSANTPEANKPGTIGQPFPGIEVRVVDLDTQKPLPEGELGMLLVAGPTIFPGYLGYEGPSPFVEQDGKRWYVTGDLARIDADGFIYFSGRLKRFLKSGGEMISLPALEEPFSQAYPPTKDGPQVAIEGVERDGTAKVVLFATVPITLREANQRLESAGFHGVMRLSEVRAIDKIPVLGTGKTDYKVLRAML
jgi:long-chain-fatty-acid--[acyl-carrier-protein] ligase